MENLTEFLNENKMRLQNILEELNWTTSSLMSVEDANSNKQPETSQDNEPLFPPSCASQGSVLLDNNKIFKILGKTATAPQKFSDLQVNFNREEKLLLYEYVANQTDVIVPVLDENADLVSIADIVAMKKREKKNRRKHRVSKPTHTEELRNLVELQMKSLEQHLKNKYGTESLAEHYECNSKKVHQKQCQSPENTNKELNERRQNNKKYGMSMDNFGGEQKGRVQTQHREKYGKSKIEKNVPKYFHRSRNRENHSNRCNDDSSQERSRRRSKDKQDIHSKTNYERMESVNRARRSRSNDRYHHSKGDKNPHNHSKTNYVRIKSENGSRRSYSNDRYHRSRSRSNDGYRRSRSHSNDRYHRSRSHSNHRNHHSRSRSNDKYHRRRSHSNDRYHRSRNHSKVDQDPQNRSKTNYVRIKNESESSSSEYKRTRSRSHSKSYHKRKSTKHRSRSKHRRSRSHSRSKSKWKKK